MDAPTVAVSDDGKKFAVGWMGQPADKDRDVFWAVSAGGALPPEFRLPDDPRAEQGHPTSGADREGVFHIAWEDARGGKTAIYYATSKPGAKNQRLSAGDGEATFPSLSAGRNLGVVWEQNGGVEFRNLR